MSWPMDGPVGGTPTSMAAVIGAGRRVDGRRWLFENIRSIEVVLARNAHQCEQCVTAGIGEGCPHAMGCSHLADRADRPVRCNPFAGGMCEKGRELDLPGGLVDRRGLDRGDFVLAQALADDIEATCQ